MLGARNFYNFILSRVFGVLFSRGSPLLRQITPLMMLKLLRQSFCLLADEIYEIRLWYWSYCAKAAAAEFHLLYAKIVRISAACRSWDTYYADLFVAPYFYRSQRPLYFVAPKFLLSVALESLAAPWFSLLAESELVAPLEPAEIGFAALSPAMPLTLFM